MEPTRYKVNLDSYEGPMDLLLHLVNKEEVDIYDISIETLTLQYLEYLETFKVLNIPLASEFLVMASQLLYIKSRALLPKQVLLEDDEETDDPRWDLIRQLLEYKKFKEAATHLQRSQQERTNIYGKAFSLVDESETSAEIQEISPVELLQAFQTVLKRFEDSIEIGEISDDQYNVSDKIEYLLSHLTRGKIVNFSELAHSFDSKQELIVTFLAILELTKLNKLMIRQEESCGDLLIELS